MCTDLPDTINPLEEDWPIVFDLRAGPAHSGSAPTVTRLERMTKPKPLLLYEHLITEKQIIPNIVGYYLWTHVPGIHP